MEKTSDEMVLNVDDYACVLLRFVDHLVMHMVSVNLIHQNNIIAPRSYQLYGQDPVGGRH